MELAAGTAPWGGSNQEEHLASGFVNSAVQPGWWLCEKRCTGLFTKPPVGVLLGWNHPQGPFQPPAPFTAYGSFRNCTRQNHGTARNCEVGSFVNSAGKLLYCLSPARTLSRDCSCWQFTFTANGHFSIPLEWYQSKPRSSKSKAGGSVNSAVKQS